MTLITMKLKTTQFETALSWIHGRSRLSKNIDIKLARLQEILRSDNDDKDDEMR